MTGFSSGFYVLEKQRLEHCAKINRLEYNALQNKSDMNIALVQLAQKYNGKITPDKHYEIEHQQARLIRLDQEYYNIMADLKMIDGALRHTENMDNVYAAAYMESEIPQSPAPTTLLMRIKNKLHIR